MLARVGLKILALIAVAGVLAAAGWYGHREHLRNFEDVHGGVLYRSGQPADGAWPLLAREYNIRTVISLREHRPESPWWQAEEDACRSGGIRIIHIPLESKNEPTPQEWGAFYSTLNDPANWPVLVHCELGSSRTGLMVGSYRVAIQGWSVRRAIKDAREHYFKESDHPEYVDFWRKLRAQTKSIAVGGEK